MPDDTGKDTQDTQAAPVGSVVFLAYVDVDHEGSQVLGIHHSLETAQQRAWEHADAEARDAGWRAEEGGWWGLGSRSTSWSVHMETVEP